MERFTAIADLRAFLEERRQEGRSVAFVPTMGALHGGHRSCVDVARSLADVTVVSIFVNPTQFGPAEDLDAYPRPITQDLAHCEAWGCDAVFLPDREAVYPGGQVDWVEPGPLATPLCGRMRPGHFRGVTTVVHKLLSIVEPDVAVFGQKDAQQALVIQDMTRRLGMPIRIALSPTVREQDGLAVSSRNAYLNEAQRRRAASLYLGLQVGLDAVRTGTMNPNTVTARVRDFMTDAGILEVEYIELLDARTLTDLKTTRGHMLLAGAVRLDGTRLIDNLVIDAGDDGSVRETSLF
jgi:pantoate--beta-alanine ligase